MICRIEANVERRKMRLKFFQDDVFVIAHKTIKNKLFGLSLEELFCSADKVVNHLLVNEITNEDFIDYEMDDLKDECNDENLYYLLISIAFVKLCALRKVNPIAGVVAKALVHRCQEYEDFTDLLKTLAREENKIIAEKGRIDLLNYELKSIVKETQDDSIINEFINSTLECSVKVIEDVMVAFENFNEEQNHKFDMQQKILTQGYKDKQAGKEAKNIMIENADFHDTSFGCMYDVHGNDNVHTGY